MIGQALQRFPHFGRELARMIDVNAHTKRMILLEHRAKLRRDALGEKDRNPRADAEKFDVRNRAQSAQHLLELGIAEEKRVATGQKDVAHFSMFLEIFEGVFKLS